MSDGAPVLRSITEMDSSCNSNTMISQPQFHINMQLRLIDV